MAKPVWGKLLLLSATGLVIGMSSAGVFNYFAPKKFESFALIEMKPRPSEYQHRAYEESQNVRSLRQLSKNLDLAKRWETDLDTSVEILKTSIIWKKYRGTQLELFRVRLEKPQDAFEVAVEWFRMFESAVSQSINSYQDKELAAVKKSFNDQRNKIEQLRQEIGTEGDDNENKEKQQLLSNEIATLEKMKWELMSRRVPSGEPVLMMPIIHDKPTLADTPISPNIRLNLSIGGVVGLLLVPMIFRKRWLPQTGLK